MIYVDSFSSFLKNCSHHTTFLFFIGKCCQVGNGRVYKVLQQNFLINYILVQVVVFIVLSFISNSSIFFSRAISNVSKQGRYICILICYDGLQRLRFLHKKNPITQTTCRFFSSLSFFFLFEECCEQILLEVFLKKIYSQKILRPDYLLLRLDILT